MCLIALAIGASPHWPLVLASNRDEYLDRPTLPLQHWQGPRGAALLSGRDLEAGGTWLGVSQSGRVAMLTNVREPGMRAGARSRGGLPLAWLEGDQDAARFLAGLDAQAYSGFNLVFGHLHSAGWHWVSNRCMGSSGIEPGWQERALGPGIYGLSNAFLDTPWPKTRRLSQALLASLGAQLDEETLWQALADASPAAQAELPATGVPAEAERQLSSAWVRFADGRYGTRSSTLLSARASGQGMAVRMQEKTWPQQGEPMLREHTLYSPRA
jgi:uncharacterized protein with NRDE domain